MEYIKKEKVLQILFPAVERKFPVISKSEYVMLYNEIKELGAESVTPALSGKYIIDEFGDATCSVCGADFLDSTRKYCPECAARLTKESGDG